VTCVSGSDCWAVGYFSNGTVVQTLTEHWNGTSWSIVSSPNTSTTDLDTLRGVTCISGSDCWAVGYYSNNSGIPNQTLTEHWNGISWSIISSPNIGTMRSNYLYGVTCTSTAQCWAVGNNQDVGAFIEQWNGSAWSVATSPSIGFGANSQLNGVSCASGLDCWAVGYYLPTSGPSQTLSEHWDGTSWSIINTGSLRAQVLQGVTCASGSDCLAVGYYFSTHGPSQTLTEHWDGVSWSIVSSPNTSATQLNDLLGVTCTSTAQCWAVGHYNNGSIDQTLIEEYTLTIPPLTGIASRMNHGGAGAFDIDLPLTGMRGVECRSSTSLGAGNYAVVFTFVNNVTSCGTAGTTGGSVSSGPNPNQCTENLTNLPNAQYTAVTLNNVLDSLGNTGNVSAPMGVLLGDVDASGRVDSTDVFQVRQQTLQNANSSNFRMDVDASGRIDSTDVFITRQQTLTSLPSSP
jgi:ligand-binding SRPBCC domain-containing protein